MSKIAIIAISNKLKIENKEGDFVSNVFSFSLFLSLSLSFSFSFSFPISFFSSLSLSFSATVSDNIKSSLDVYFDWKNTTKKNIIKLYN